MSSQDQSQAIPYPLDPDGSFSKSATGVEDLAAGNPILSPQEQLAQLESFFSVHYPEVWAVINSFGPISANQFVELPREQRLSLKADAEQAVARLESLITHTSQLMLGGGLDHSMPGTAWGSRAELLTTPDLPETAFVLFPSTLPSDLRALPKITRFYLGGPGWHGSGPELEIFWLPLVAALAELSGIPAVVMHHGLYPLVDGERAVDEANQRLESDFAAVRSYFGDPEVTAVAFGSGAVAAVEYASAHGCTGVVLQQPRLGDETLPRLEGTSVSIVRAAGDTIACGQGVVAAQLRAVGAVVDECEIEGAGHILATPSAARDMVQTVAARVRGVPGLQ